MILRDPVHGLVAFESEEESVVVALLKAAEVQRLRRVRQLGVTSVAFPGAEHTRFAHAIGAAFVMKLLIARLRTIHEELPFGQRLTAGPARDALAAALLHDVGHGPLSHLFEDVIPGAPKHETWTERIVTDPSTDVHRVLTSLDPAMPERVAGLVHGSHPLPYLAKAVSGTFDVDRCDYLLRDAYSTGVGYGQFDLAWMLRSLRFTPSPSKPGEDPGAEGAGQAPSLGIDGAKGLPAIEAFILARLFMFQQVYLHKASRAAEWMIKKALARVVTLLQDGESLPAVPRALAEGALGRPVSLGDYLELDDATLSVAFHAWEGAKDPVLSDLARSVRARALYKTIELFGDQAEENGRAAALALSREIARARGFDPEYAVGLDVASTHAFESDEDPLLVIYTKGPPRKLGDVSFLLGRLMGQVVSRARLVVAPELRRDVTRALGI